MADGTEIDIGQIPAVFLTKSRSERRVNKSLADSWVRSR